MTTLAEFITIGKVHGRANLHIKVPDFHVFYARYGRRIINHVAYKNVFDIATVEVKRHLLGTGVFTRLFEQLRRQYPTMHIYVENATLRFGRMLTNKLGFRSHEFNPDCFYYLGDQCSESTSTTGVPGTESGSSSATGTEIPSATTGIIATSSSNESASTEPRSSPVRSSDIDRSTSWSKDQTLTYLGKDHDE